MRHEVPGDASLPYAPCRYGMSRQFFRGPRRSLESPYLAFIGGTETYGKFIEHPFPQLVETGLGKPCVNFGVVNAGIDAYVGDPAIVQACADADLTVLQIMGAQNLSNRFYKVHPRRNDRFLSASTVMKALFADVDFADFTFTRHLLSVLYSQYPDRFEILRSELQEAWTARMRSLLSQIGPRVILLWFSESKLSDDKWNDRPEPFKSDPLFVTKSMVESFGGMVADIVEAQPSSQARSSGTKGMVFPMLSNDAAHEILGPLAHEEAAAILLPAVRRVIAA